MISDPTRSDMSFISGQARDPNAPARSAGGGGGGGGEGGGPAVTVQGLPLLKPPYGTISATDLNKGEMVWKIAHGETPDAVKNHPALKGLTIPRTGRANGRIGVLVTKTLVIAGEAWIRHDAERPARRHAARVRQDDRSRTRCGLHACAPDGIADDLHAGRQTVSGRGRIREWLQRGDHRFQSSAGAPRDSAVSTNCATVSAKGCFPC